MKHRRDTNPTNRRPSHILLIMMAAMLVAAIGVGVYGLILAPDNTPESPPSASPPTTTMPPPAAPPSSPGSSRKDPEVFARRAATMLFDWDTATMNPSDVTDKLMALADPTGQESAGLASDIANSLPDQTTWTNLRSKTTTQRLEIDTVTVPGSWADVLGQAKPGQMLPGTLAYTVTGTRHRDGTWGDQSVVYTAPITFTMFIACAPTFPECHLLRLSLPDQPLK